MGIHRQLVRRILYFVLRIGIVLVGCSATEEGWAQTGEWADDESFLSFHLGFEASLGGDVGGGDELLRVEFSDGSESRITANDGLRLMLGPTFTVSTRERRHGLELQALVGVKYSTIPNNDDGSADYLRWPVEGLLFYRALLVPADRSPLGDIRLRVGGGIYTFLGASLDGSGVLDDLSVDFDPAVGGIIQGEFIFSFLTVGARYSTISLPVRGTSVDVDASGFGFVVALNLPYLLQLGG